MLQSKGAVMNDDDIDKRLVIQKLMHAMSSIKMPLDMAAYEAAPIAEHRASSEATRIILDAIKKLREEVRAATA